MEVTEESRDNLVRWFVSGRCEEPEWFDVVEQVLRNIENDRWDRLMYDTPIQVREGKRLPIRTEIPGMRVLVDLISDGDGPIAHLVSIVVDPDAPEVTDEWHLP